MSRYPKIATLNEQIDAIHHANSLYWKQGERHTRAANAEYQLRQDRLERIRAELARLRASDDRFCSTNGGIEVTSPQEFTPTCPLCNQPVILETSKADEQGRAVHEDCYAQKVTLHLATRPPLES